MPSTNNLKGQLAVDRRLTKTFCLQQTQKLSFYLVCFVFFFFEYRCHFQTIKFVRIITAKQLKTSLQNQSLTARAKRAYATTRTLSQVQCFEATALSAQLVRATKEKTFACPT